jgi:hypothetical protein
MSTAAVSNTSLHQELQQYFQTRQSDLQQLGQALKSGDLAGAQAAYGKITALGQNGPFGGGNPFQINQREQDFSAVGKALQSGDLAGAQQAFSALEGTFTGGAKHPDPHPASSSSGPEIILNLSNSGSSSPEQITINISNPAQGGGEQVSLSIGNQGSNAQQVTLNLSANSNEQIILNFLGGASSTSSAAGSGSSSGAASAGISVSA